MSEPNQMDIPSFGDFEESDLDSVGSSTAPQEKPEPESPATVPAAAPSQSDFFERMAQIDAERENQRQAQAAEAARREENRKRWAEIHTPPPLPEGEDAEKLVLDPQALLDVVKKNQDWTRNLVASYGSAMNQLREETSQIVQRSQAETALATIAASRVSNQVSNRLRDEGFDDIDAAMEEADIALASDPSRYLAYRTSPEHFEQAVRFVINQRGGQSGQPQPARRVANNPALPYTPGAPTSSGAALSSAITREDIARAQRLLGHKFTTSALRKAGVR